MTEQLQPIQMYNTRSHMASTNNTVQSIWQMTSVILYWYWRQWYYNRLNAKKRDKLQFNLTWLHRRRDTIIYNSCNNIVIVVISTYRRMMKRVERTLIKLMKKTDGFLTDYNYYHSIWNLKKYIGRLYDVSLYLYTRVCTPSATPGVCHSFFRC